MTARQLIEFLSGYDGETIVTMLQCTDDNPMCDEILIKDVIAIKRFNGEISIVIIPGITEVRKDEKVPNHPVLR